MRGSNRGLPRHAHQPPASQAPPNGDAVIVGGYTLHLYCDAKGCKEAHGRASFGEFAGGDAKEAWKEARAYGWKSYPAQGLVVCGSCHKAGRTCRR
jgi:hypothetical protein